MLKLLAKLLAEAEYLHGLKVSPPQIFGNYKGKNGDFVVEGLGRNQFSQVIGVKYIGMSDACDVMCPWIQCTEKGLSPL